MVVEVVVIVLNVQNKIVVKYQVNFYVIFLQKGVVEWVRLCIEWIVNVVKVVIQVKVEVKGELVEGFNKDLFFESDIIFLQLKMNVFVKVSCI